MNPENQATITSICENMYAQYLRYGTVESGSFDDEPDLKWARSGRPMFNFMLGADFKTEKAKDRVAQVTEMARGWQVNVLWQMGPNAALSGTVDAAVECGWSLCAQSTGMDIQLEEPVPDVSLPDGLTISRADDNEALRAWTQIYFAAAPPDYREALTGLICELGCGDHLPWSYYIGYLNGNAVASSMIFAGAGAAGLYYIGTLPDFRKRGFGTAMTKHSLQQAQLMGYNRVVLQATDMGMPVYRTVGFQEYCKIPMLLLRA